MIDNVIAFLLFLVSISGSVSILIEQLKPIVFDKILEKAGEQVYLLSIYIGRSLAALFTIAMLGGYPTLVGLVPFFANVPELGVYLISVLLASLGSDYLHVILDFLYAVRDNSRGDTVGSSTGDGSTNVTVNAPTDTSSSDIVELVKQLNEKGVGALG